MAARIRVANRAKARGGFIPVKIKLFQLPRIGTGRFCCGVEVPTHIPTAFRLPHPKY